MSNEPREIESFDTELYNAQTKKHVSSRLMVSSTTGEITSKGKTPPPEWIPTGWVQLGDNRWVPQWPACRYRRLSVEMRDGTAPNIQIHCLVNVKQPGDKMENITIDVCQACTVFSAHEPKKIPIDEEKLRQVFAREIADHHKQKSKDGRQVLYEEEYLLTGYSEQEQDKIEEEFFNQAMAGLPEPSKNPHHPRNRRKLHIQWNVPCVHRMRVEKTQEEKDCKGCGDSKIICNNSDAELFGKILTRKLCKGCPCPEPPK